MTAPATPAERVRPGLGSGRRWAFFAPLLAFTGMAVALGWGLSHDPSEVPSVLIGRPVPAFSLPPVRGRTLGLATVIVSAGGRIAYKHIGPVTEKVLERTILRLVERLRAEAARGKS